MAILTSRRAFLASSSSILALAGCGGPSGSNEAASDPAETVLEASIEPTADDIEIAELMANEFQLNPDNQVVDGRVAPIKGGEQSKAGKIARARQQLARDPDKRWFYWPDDDSATFDYRHIVDMGDTVSGTNNASIPTSLTDTVFDLTPALLQSLMDANYFEHAIQTTLADNEAANGRIIVALRGAEIVNAGSEDAPTIQLRDRRPSHRDPHCVYVVWHRRDEEDDELAVFEGATVPSELYLALFQTLKTSGLRSSMVPQGFHLRKLGNMRISATNTHSNTLRQASTCPVIREPSPERDAFDLAHSVWDPSSSSSNARSVGAHLHAGYWDVGRPNGWKWRFSSAGCQTICGSVSNDTYRRDIRDFYAAMDIPEAELVDGELSNDKYDTIYPMVILTGREARLHADGADMSAMRRVRIGSSGDIEADPDHPIAQVQTALGVTADGQFGAGSMLKFLDAQASGAWVIGSAADGIVTPEFARSQNIDLV